MYSRGSRRRSGFATPRDDASDSDSSDSLRGRYGIPRDFTSKKGTRSYRSEWSRAKDRLSSLFSPDPSSSYSTTKYVRRAREPRESVSRAFVVDPPKARVRRYKIRPSSGETEFVERHHERSRSWSRSRSRDRGPTRVSTDIYSSRRSRSRESLGRVPLTVRVSESSSPATRSPRPWSPIHEPVPARAGQYTSRRPSVIIREPASPYPSDDVNSFIRSRPASYYSKSRSISRDTYLEPDGERGRPLSRYRSVEVRSPRDVKYYTSDPEWSRRSSFSSRDTTRPTVISRSPRRRLSDSFSRSRSSIDIEERWPRSVLKGQNGWNNDSYRVISGTKYRKPTVRFDDSQF
ncbi:hypothetical protein N7462_009908 [Penicillium macrosclerotiorum]|uniref:uncharacterized protein n=1 Tax=Penicillium macrosclerotiorum TaxID=303699 RepID=UPI0025483528|nr:uncharacterized protein N7462_009908 [Penicillium macrosclerotiorum]KAJ5668838.1 hypothetical protein N7462_009908 [Penicillium macrosclerotiorum]